MPVFRPKQVTDHSGGDGGEPGLSEPHAGPQDHERPIFLLISQSLKATVYELTRGTFVHSVGVMNTNKT